MDNSVGFTFFKIVCFSFNNVIVVCKEDVWIAQKHLKR